MTPIVLNEEENRESKSSVGVFEANFAGLSNLLFTAAKALENAIPNPGFTERVDRPVGPSATLQRMMKARSGRSEFFPAGLFSDPAWEILLDLYAAELEQRRISITSIGLAATVPSTTTQRWLHVLVAKGMVCRRPDPLDARRIFVELHHDASLTLKKYFAFVEALPLV